MVVLHLLINLLSNYLLWVVVNKQPSNDLELFVVSFVLTIGSFAHIMFVFAQEKTAKSFVKDLILIIIAIMSISSFIIQLQVDKGTPINKKHKNGVIKQVQTNIKRLSVYNSVKKQCDGTPLITADNSKIDLDNFPKNWIALSRDLLQRFNKDAPYKFGDSVLLITNNIEYDGVYVIHDTMDSTYTKTVDILLEDFTLHLDSHVVIYKI